MSTYTGIGCMSGSSLDGLDICCVEFTGDLLTDLWGYKILKAETIPYTQQWVDRLGQAGDLSGIDLIKLHVDYGHFLGDAIDDFIRRNDLSWIEFISSHGHTVFHQPDKGFTFQIGDGETTASHLAKPFVCNFRNKDVALGGEGAPLVPCGEKFLFNSIDLCINLGGIANIGVKGQTGYDICPCNMVLNRLALLSNERLPHDVDGAIAARGDVIPEVLRNLESLLYYKEGGPKSLGREWVEENVLPVLDVSRYNVPDLMRTAAEHIALRIVAECDRGRRSLGAKSEYSVILTGGGAFNKFLVSLIREKMKKIHIEAEPVDDDTINFKEALIFAFLGLRCLLGVENVTCDITGARGNTISGSIHRPKQTDPLSPSVSRKFRFSLH